jgi:hypothetical protein
MTDKLFTHAGVSQSKGQFKSRFATDAARIKVLMKTGHDNIDILQLPEPMTKVDALEYLLSINFEEGRAEIRAALEDGLARRQTKTKQIKEPVAA